MESTIEQPRQAGFPRRVSSRLLPQSWQMPFTTAGFPASTLNNSSTGMSLVFVFFCFLGLWKETAILVVRAAIRSLVSLFESVSFEGLGCGMSSSLEESSNFLGTTPLNCWVSAIFLTTKAGPSQVLYCFSYVAHGFLLLQGECSISGLFAWL